MRRTRRRLCIHGCRQWSPLRLPTAMPLPMLRLMTNTPMASAHGRLGRWAHGAVLTGAACLAGCAQYLLDDDRLRWSTAGALGVPSAQVSIGERRDVVEGTHYVATTRAGLRYRCFVFGGGLLSAGFTNAPRCQPE